MIKKVSTDISVQRHNKEAELRSATLDAGLPLKDAAPSQKDIQSRASRMQEKVGGAASFQFHNFRHSTQNGGQKPFFVHVLCSSRELCLVADGFHISSRTSSNRRNPALSPVVGFKGNE